MKVVLIFILCLFTLFSMFSGSVDNQTNITAGYLRTLNRNAVMDSNDAIIYNPAATAFYDEGVYLSLGYKFFDDHIAYTQSGNVDPYDAYKEANTLPYFSFALKFEESKFCFFASLYSPAGRGEFVYHDLDVPGNETVISSEFYASVFGFSYAPFHFLSMAFYLKSIKGGRLYSDSASSFYLRGTSENVSPALSFQIKFSEKMNFTMRYEARTMLTWEVYQSDTATWIEKDRDLPEAIYLGLGYLLTDNLRLEGSANFYLIRTSDWEGLEKDYDDGFEAGLSAEYTLNEKVLLSSGVLYTKTGETFFETSNYEVCLTPALDSFSIALGTQLSLNKNYSIDIAFNKPFYDEASGYNDFLGSDFEVEREAWEMAIGLNCKF